MLEVVVESFLKTFNVSLDVVVAVEDFLTAFSPFLHWEGFIVFKLH